jgi:glycosyltransferase involved in cell wall biosynthesis
MPRISVVMPVYNVERFVSLAILSVLRQTWQDWELVIVDDGATDASPEIIAGFRDPRIRIIRQQNRGLAGARNTGIRHARGEILAFLDSDDLWAPDKLARHVEHLDAHPDVGVSFAPSRLIDDDGHWLGLVQTPMLTNITPADILCRNPIGNGSAPVIRRIVFDDIAYEGAPKETWWFDETFRQSEDIECWMRIALQTAWRFEGLPAPLTDYRVSTAGLSANVMRQYESWERMIAKVRDLDPAFARRHVRRARAYQLRYLARRAVRMRSRGLAARLAWHSLLLCPRILLQEPKRTLATLVAATLLPVLPSFLFAHAERLGLSLAAARSRHARS